MTGRNPRTTPLPPRPALVLLRTLARALRRVGVGLLALLILFEEWGWEPLRRVLVRLSRLALFRWVETRVRRLPPPGALVVLLLPSLGLIPVKLLALWLIGTGRALTGLLVVLAAKVVGTALLAWLFDLTRPALMRMPWFAALYGRWFAWKEALLARVRASWVWRTGRTLRQAVRRRWARWRRAWPH